MRKIYSQVICAMLTLICFMQTGIASAADFQESTAENPIWYRIYAPNRGARTITSSGVGENLMGNTNASYTDNQLWRIEKRSDNSYNIICKANNVYIDPSTTTKVGNNPVFRPVAAVPSKGWTITSISGKTGLVTIASGSIQLHQGGDGDGNRIINWGSGNNTSDAGCQFSFESYDPSDPAAHLRVEALALYNNSTEGTNPGEYTSEARTTLKNAIDKATTVDEFNTAISTFNAAMNTVKLSTSTENTYYYIVSGPSVAYCQGKAIYYTTSDSHLKWGDKTKDPNFLWKMEDAGNGKYYIRNMASQRYMTAPITNGTSTTASAYTIKSLGQSAFNIVADGSNPIHAENTHNIVNWAGGLNTASAWKFEEVPSSSLNDPVVITSATVKQGFLSTAPGNKDHTLLYFTTNVSGFVGTTSINGVTLNLSGSTNATADVEKVKVWYTPDAYFNGDKKANAVLLGEAPVTDGTITVNFTEPRALSFGSTNFWITADIKSSATVDNQIDATLLTIVPSAGNAVNVNNNPNGKIRIFKDQVNLFNPWDENSHYWRIPAMIVLKNSQNDKNGRIVSITDKRYNSNGDLPNKIDLIARNSDDNGKTWGDTTIVAGVQGREPDYGYGDGAMVETKSGKIVVLMAADKQFQGSSYSAPIRVYMNTSTNSGESWNIPTDITKAIYGATYTQGQLQGVFATSGKGLCLEHQSNAALNGRIMFAIVCKFSSGSYQNYVVYSDDEGATWKASSQSAYDGADEAKLMEDKDGKIYISVRRSGARGFNTSTDGGVTWGTQYTVSAINGAACNSDILKYSNKIWLHTIPVGGDRSNLTIYASTDQGKTWGKSKVLSQLGAGYSTLERLANGDVAVYFEDGTVGDGYTMNFMTFPITWLVDGDPDEATFRETVAAARTLAEKATYVNVESAKVGEYNATIMESLKAKIPTENQIAAIEDYVTANTALRAIIDRVLSTAIIVEGFEPGTLFTITSKENIGDKGQLNLALSGNTVSAVSPVATDSLQMWYISASATDGNVYIKNIKTGTYMGRLSRTGIGAQSAPWNWKLVQAEDKTYYSLLGEDYNPKSYSVINVTTGALDYWSSTDGNETWSTKYLLKKVGAIDTDIHTATVNNITVSNGRISVNGTNNFKVYNSVGVKMSNNNQLPTGIYLVKANGTTTTVYVK